MKRLLERLAILDILFFAIPFTAGSVYLLSFYPGILTYDSLAQWHQLSQFQFNNWHPAYHTLLMWLVTRIYDSPTSVAWFQIAVFSAVMAYGLRTFKDLGVPAPLLLLLDSAISFALINGMMVITLWKDVLYGFAVLLLSIYVLKIIASRGDWLASGWNWLFLGLTLANVTLLRHNGFPVATGTILIILLVFARRKAALIALAFSIVFIGIVSGPLFTILKVDREDTQPTGVVLIHPLAAYVQAGASFSAEEAAYLDRIRPLKDGWPYSCHDATVLFFQGVSFQPLKDDPLSAARLLGRLTLASPMVTLRHFKCLSSFVWQPSQPERVPLETIYIANQDLSSHPEWQEYAPIVDQNTKLPWLKDWLVKQISASYEEDHAKILWRPAVYLYAFCLSTLVFSLRRKNARILILLVPALLQTLIIALSTQLQSLRYQYPVYLLGMLFTLPVLYLAVWKPECWQAQKR